MHADDEIVLRGHAEVFEFKRVELNSGFTQQLLQGDAAEVVADGKAVGLGDLVKIISRDDAACACHVFDDQTRVARNMFAHVTGDRAGIDVVASARCEADDNADGFALVKIGLSEGVASP